MIFRDGVANMKMFLSLLAASISFLHAQDVASSAFGSGEGVNGEVNAVAVQPDGKVVIGGRFTSVNGIPRNNLARLNADGSLDRSFVDTPTLGVNGPVHALAIQSDGAIVVGGLFTQAGEREIMNLTRYAPDGSPDKAFGAGTGEVGTNDVVLALAVREDGSILVGGNFNVVFGQPRRGLAILNSDGSLGGKTTFLNGSVKALASTAEFPAVAGGLFPAENQNARNLFQLK